MKLKKIIKILPCWESIRVWGNDEDTPLYKGCVEDLPKRIENLKLIKSKDSDSYFDVRYNCCDCENHIAIFVQED